MDSRMMRSHTSPVLVISDDVTGCVDSGALFLGEGRRVVVAVDPKTALEERRVAGCNTLSLGSAPCDLLSFNMSSRTLPGNEARTVHEALAQELSRHPRRLAVKKMDIGFRGNASFEIEGLMRGFGVPVCFLMVHSPWRNTYTLNGIQYYEGVPLERSIVSREDPLKRPIRSDICGILAADTALPVRNVGIDEVRGGTLARYARRMMDEGGRILVFDAVTKEDGCRIVGELEPLFPEALWAGSGGLAWALATHLYGKVSQAVLAPSYQAPRCACFCGSKFSTTRNQIDIARRECGLEEVHLYIGEAVGKMVDEKRRWDEVSRAAGKCLAAMAEGKDFILLPNVPPELENSPKVERLDQQILAALSDCAQEVCTRRTFDRLVVVGGETAQAVFGKLGVRFLQLQERPESGVGAGTILGGPFEGKSFSVKGGVCGSPEALCRMLGKALTS